jgi:flagellar basal-body rod modification protein FlgD
MALLPITPSTTTPGAASITGSGADRATIAENFSTFLQLLTTQLKNQNPMDPLDTNQFTQQLVQFAQVEQQMKQNDQLSQIIAIEKNAQNTVALSYVGHTVVVEGNTSQLSVPGMAAWTMNITKPATATVTVKDSTGQTCYTGTFSVQPGQQNFTWDGKGNDGKQWPAGSYTLTATAKDASGETAAISTEVIAIVDSVDLTKDPPILSINGKDYTVDQIKRVLRPIVTAPPVEEETNNPENTAFSQLLSALPLGL